MGLQVPANHAPCVAPRWQAPPVDATLLRERNGHPRDLDITFRADTHVYLVRGVPTLGSVTGVIHHWAQPFDPDETIGNMQRSRNWPAAQVAESAERMGR